MFQLVRSWLLEVTLLSEIIFSHPGGFRPAMPYGLLNVLRAQRINWEDDVYFTEESDGIVESLSEEWEFTISFNVYGPESMKYLCQVASATRSAAAHVALFPLVLHTTSSVRHLPELINEVWEDRSQIDLTFRSRELPSFAGEIVEQATSAVSIIP